MKCDVDIRKELYADVVVSPGMNMFQEFVERMTKELMADGIMTLSALNASVAWKCRPSRIPVPTTLLSKTS